MAITGIGYNYNDNVYENTYASQKNETAKKAEVKDTTSAQAGNTKKVTVYSIRLLFLFTEEL